jgi:hypothetical protein
MKAEVMRVVAMKEARSQPLNQNPKLNLSRNRQKSRKKNLLQSNV